MVSLCCGATLSLCLCQAEEPASPWQSSPGSGFRAGAQSFSLLAGANYGIGGFGSHEAHHLALASLSYGRMLTRVVGEDRWWQGNLELRLELFGGAQFSPDTDWIVGLTPYLRYNFATGSRLIPFIGAGAGLTATGIGEPDLGGVFQFNEQGGAGLHWLLKNDLALTIEARYIHVSNAGIDEPNRGLNGVIGLIGVTRFF
jgi:lipid A 3-O-deacylase